VAPDSGTRVDSDVAFAGLGELADGLRERRFRSVELLELYLRRIEAHRHLNAVVTLDERALDWAEERDAEAAAGRLRGPLHGVPMTVKDALETAGLRTTSGAPELTGFVPQRDAAVVERLRIAGAVIFGKTNLPPWASDLQTDNPVFGRTANPWHPERSPGGSSGGAAAAVAAGLSGAEIGSDIGGSIRQPAANCGVFGLKPTWGIVPGRGHIPGAPGPLAEIDVASLGPIARAADDLELLLDVIAGPDELRAGAWQLRLRPASVSRIGCWFDDDDYPLDDEVRAALEAAAAEVGAEPVQPPVQLAEALELYYRLVAPELSRGEAADSIARWRVEADGRAAPPDVHSDAAWEHWGVGLHRDWLDANEERARLQARWAAACSGYDVVLMPVTPLAAQPHQPEPTDRRTLLVNGAPAPWRVLSPWLWIIGLLQLPAAAAPIGLTSEGLPVGMQLVGRFGGDRATIEAARRIGRFERPPAFG
jgi:amidase